METKTETSPTLDRAHYKRNKKTAWLEFHSALTAWLWAHKEGQARWTLELDDAIRRASALHPSTTAAGLLKQTLHQSILKNALVRAYASFHPDLISMHPNTDAQDASGNIVPFGTKLLGALAMEFSPGDSEGVSQSTLELEVQLEHFPGNARGIGALNGWCQRVQILFTDLSRISAGDINQHTCAQIDRMLTRFDALKKETLKWYRLKDKVHALPEYIAAPKVSIYLDKIKRFAQDYVDAQKLGKGGKHSTSVFSAAALCWICGGAGHDAQQCKMLQTALADYRSKHLHKGPPRFGGSSSKTKHGPQGARGPQDGKKLNKRVRPARFNTKPQQDKKFKHKSRGTNAGHAVHFAASSIADLPPPQPEDAQHFAFHATCYPCAGAVSSAIDLEYARVADIEAAGVNYEEVYPGKRRRLTGPALASPDKEPHVESSDSPEEEDEARIVDSSDSSEEESVASGKDELTVSFNSDSSDDDYAATKTEQAAAAKTVHVLHSGKTEQEKLFGNYLREALYSDTPLQLVPGLNVFDRIIDYYPSPQTAIIEVCIGAENELKEIRMPMPPDPVFIEDHPYSHFLHDVQRELTATGCIHVFEDGEHCMNGDLLYRRILLYTKILAFLDNPCCASWTDDKEITPDVLRQLINIGTAAPTELLMYQIRIYMHAYLEEIHDDLAINYITRAVFQIPDLNAIGKDFGKDNWITASFIRDDAGKDVFVRSVIDEPVISLPPWDIIENIKNIDALRPPANIITDSGATININIKAAVPALTDTGTDKLNSHALAHQDSAHEDSAHEGRAYSPTAPIICD